MCNRSDAAHDSTSLQVCTEGCVHGNGRCDEQRKTRTCAGTVDTTNKSAKERRRRKVGFASHGTRRTEHGGECEHQQQEIQFSVACSTTTATTATTTVEVDKLEAIVNVTTRNKSVSFSAEVEEYFYDTLSRAPSTTQITESNIQVEGDSNSEYKQPSPLPSPALSDITAATSPSNRGVVRIDVNERIKNERKSAWHDLLGFACCCGVLLTVVVTLVLLSVVGHYF